MRAAVAAKPVGVAGVAEVAGVAGVVGVADLAAMGVDELSMVLEAMMGEKM